MAVVDAAQAEAVLFGADGAAAALLPGAAVMLCPTIAPQDTEALCERLLAQGLDAIDAPMSGGPQRAREGTMSLMVALSLIHISEPTRLRRITYAVFCL